VLLPLKVAAIETLSPIKVESTSTSTSVTTFAILVVGSVPGFQDIKVGSKYKDNCSASV
jgi:hypothetical protein